MTEKKPPSNPFQLKQETQTTSTPPVPASEKSQGEATQLVPSFKAEEAASPGPSQKSKRRFGSWGSQASNSSSDEVPDIRKTLPPGHTLPSIKSLVPNEEEVKEADLATEDEYSTENIVIKETALQRSQEEDEDEFNMYAAPPTQRIRQVGAPEPESGPQDLKTEDLNDDDEFNMYAAPPTERVRQVGAPEPKPQPKVTLGQSKNDDDDEFNMYDAPPTQLVRQVGAPEPEPKPASPSRPLPFTDSNTTSPSPFAASASNHTLMPSTGSTAKLPDLKGQRLFNWSILREIGRGGTGTVFLASHISLEGYVAIKILHPKYNDDEEQVERFFREATLLFQLDHPNVVRVLDYGWSEDFECHYQVVEYLEGRELDSSLKKQETFTVRDVHNIMKQLCEALSYIHWHDIFHRDLKPSNLYLVRDPFHGYEQLKVFDFGVASTSQGAALTQLGVFHGTPAYGSPEQAEGRSKYVDARSDLYSAGILLFQLLTGKRPFESRNVMELLEKHREVPPPKLKDLAPKKRWSRKLENVVKKVLAKDPSQRYPDANTFMQQLELAFVEQEALESGAAARRKLMFVVTFLLLLGAMVAVYFVGRSQAPTSSSPTRMVIKRKAPKPKKLANEVLVRFTLKSEPSGAKVKIGSQDVGTTPLRLQGYSGSHYLFTLSSPGYRHDVAKVQLNTEPKQNLLVKLQKGTTKLAATVQYKLHTSPQGAQIRVGRQILGQTPYLLTLTAGHPLQLSLRLKGYKTRKVTLEPTNEESEQIKVFKLKPRRW